MVNAQEWLDKNYPKEQRGEIKWLYIGDKDLTGELNLIGFSNLTILYCFRNNLTKLDLNENSNLTELNCCDNNLTDVNFLSKLKPLILVKLDIRNNNLTSDLDVLTPFINLETLKIGSDNSDQINNWTISLVSLRNMTKLKLLDIRNTNINSGLEYLPNNLEHFICSTELSLNYSVQQLLNQLTVYGVPSGSDYAHLLNSWKQAHPKLIINSQTITELENILTNLNLSLNNSRAENETIKQGLQIFIFETEERIKEIKKENHDYYETKIEISPKSN